MSISETLSEMEQLVFSVVAQVLEQEHPQPDDNLFVLGVDSLSGQRVVHRLEASLGFRLSTTLLFDHPTVGSLARKLDQLLEEQLQQLEDIS